jgi:AraC family transcriptional regulator
MPRKPATRIGDGAPAVVLEETQTRFPGIEVIHRGDDIRRPTDWRIHEPVHSIVVHLSGRMDRLETELDGFGGSSGPALPGEIWTVPAGRKYASHACGQTIEYAVLRLRPDAGDIVRGSMQGPLDLAAVAGVRDDFLHHAVRKLTSAMKSRDDVSTMLAESLSQSIGLHLLRSLAPGKRSAHRRSEHGPILDARTMRLLRDFIHAGLAERITLAKLAALAALTTHQFLVAFRKAFGSTPAQYIIRQRLRRAQHQLLSTRKDITTIALDCGFSSHSHLTACFTNHIGCAPREYRKAS